MGSKLSKGNPIHGEQLHFCRPCTEVIHPHVGCNMFTYLCFQSGFISAFKAYGTLFLFSTLIKTKFRPKLEDLVLKTLPTIIRRVVSGVFPLLVCLWSKTGNHSGPSFFVLPFIAALAGIAIEKSSRRTELAVYVANQAIELYYHMLVSRGLIPPIRHGREILFTLSFSVLVYFHKHHRHLLPGSVNSLLKVIIGVENNMDIIEKHVSKFYFWYKQHMPEFIECLFSEDENTSSHRLCKHSYGCKTYAFVGFLKAFLLGLAIKASFVFFPAIVLNPKNFFSGFASNIYKVLGKSTLQFALFWGIMSGGPRGTECLLRYIRGVDDGVNSVIAGFVGGLGVVFFSSIELAMYIASKAVETLFYFAVERKITKSRKHGEILLFAFCTASLFYASAYEPHNIRESYFSWLLKASRGHWAYFFEAFTPVRLEAGVPDIQAYNNWYKNFATSVVKQYISEDEMKKYSYNQYQ